jgi:hypothetical protein
VVEPVALFGAATSPALKVLERPVLGTITVPKEILRCFIHEGDRIVVTEVGSEWASRRALSNLADC